MPPTTPPTMDQSMDTSNNNPLPAKREQSQEIGAWCCHLKAVTKKEPNPHLRHLDYLLSIPGVW